MIIDAHTHLYPPEINANPSAWALAHNEPHFAQLCTRTRKNGQLVQAFPSLDEFLRTLDAAQIDRAILLGWYWQNPSSCALQNRFFAHCIRQHPDRLSAFASIHPGSSTALDEIRRAHSEGLVGIGELSPHSTGTSTDSQTFTDILQLAAQLRLPLNIHVTDPNLPSYPGCIQTPNLLPLVQQHPDNTFILAHWAARPWQNNTGASTNSTRGTAAEESSSPLAPRSSLLPKNLYLDTAASPLLYPTETIFPEALQNFPPTRILWGSDFPLNLYPKLHPNPADSLRHFLTETKSILGNSPHSPAILGTSTRHLLRL